MCSHIKRDRNSWIVVYKKTKLWFQKGAILRLSGGNLYLGRCNGCRDYTSLRMQKDSRLIVTGKSIIEYGADILIKDHARLELNDNSYFNCRLMLRCHKNITIGKNGFFANDIDIRDCDGHSLNGKIATEDVIIGDHVWVCNNVIILKGVQIQNGAMIGAGSIVTRNVPEKCLAYGSPARVHRENIEWE